MNFHLSEQQLALKATFGRYVADQCQAGLRRRAFESADGAEPGFWQGLMDLGAGGIMVPEDHGGLGLELIDLALLAEVLGYEAAPGPFLGHALATLAIAAGGSPEQKSRWLGRLAAGEALATVALGEGSERWRPQSWTLRAESGRISGTKIGVTGAGQADIAVVGTAGGGLALVDLSDRAHVSTVEANGIDRTRRIGGLRFDGAGAEPLPNADADALFDALLVLVAADAYGAARRMLDMTVEYAKTREQFGQPIGQFQGVKHQLANLAAHVVPCESLFWYAAIAGDGGSAQARGIAAALAKAHVADRAMEAGRIAVELHGGVGYTWDYDLQIWVKRAMFDFAYGGTPAANRAHAMALKEAAGSGGAGVAQLL